MALGDFESLEEIFENKKVDQGTHPTRYLAPFAIIPGVIIVFLLTFHQSNRKSKELEANGVLTKGRVIDGQSQKTTRRFQTNTSYSIKVLYQDSKKTKHKFEASVSSSTFRNVYKGSVVDVVYSKNYPGLAKVISDIDELSKYKYIPKETVKAENLIAILTSKIRPDSVLQYLNSINYEWEKGKEANYYQNERLNLAVKIFPDEGEIVYVERTLLLMANQSETFENSLGKSGFNKKAQEVNGKSEEVYYNDKYLITKEPMKSDINSADFLSSSSFMVYHLIKLE
ncbi:hypothetical protein SanaruYs_10650 [Chryseotalea sanaruensis]|uniref:DUF3592 domain-containing protein n=1 Tax=Chryseotalea sanaruensis TaxID=2482724 RepID=A0A401U7I7_9BACT|nr:hypothetical protein SanaruYs_10650 [Chryseotalea sanaruensis]